MMPAIKRLFSYATKINKEYVLLFVIIALIGYLIYSSTAMSQASPPEEITLTTFYPSPFGEFSEVAAAIFRDYDDPMNRYLDPHGESQLQSLKVFDGIITPTVTGPTGAYVIDFTSGDATLNSIHVEGQIFMGAASAVDGKMVYDIAEGIPAKDCRPGDVVRINSAEDSFDLVPSSCAFDSRIAGVISEDPAMCMGQGGNRMPLALNGIVKCKVTDENGPIQRGDLLVSSSLAGHAMRAAPEDIKPGMLIGKALEVLGEGKGKIHILVNKQ